ncbi:MAG: PPOX class F420-dependent oxidoreductase [Candidatus Xenobia bacterium]
MEIPSNIRSFLEEKPRFGVLATVQADGLPHQSVMWWALSGNEVMFNTRQGRIKDRNLSATPQVSLCVEDEYRFATLVGQARGDHDAERTQQDIRRLAERYLGKEKAQEWMTNVFSKESRVTYRFTIERCYSQGL